MVLIKILDKNMKLFNNEHNDWPQMCKEAWSNHNTNFDDNCNGFTHH